MNIVSIPYYTKLLFCTYCKAVSVLYISIWFLYSSLVSASDVFFCKSFVSVLYISICLRCVYCKALLSVLIISICLRCTDCKASVSILYILVCTGLYSICLRCAWLWGFFFTTACNGLVYTVIVIYSL